MPKNKYNGQNNKLSIKSTKNSSNNNQIKKSGDNKQFIRTTKNSSFNNEQTKINTNNNYSAIKTICSNINKLNTAFKQFNTNNDTATISLAYIQEVNRSGYCFHISTNLYCKNEFCFKTVFDNIVHAIERIQQTISEQKFTKQQENVRIIQKEFVFDIKKPEVSEDLTDENGNTFLYTVNINVESLNVFRTRIINSIKRKLIFEGLLKLIIENYLYTEQNIRKGGDNFGTTTALYNRIIKYLKYVDNNSRKNKTSNEPDVYARLYSSSWYFLNEHPEILTASELIWYINKNKQDPYVIDINDCMKEVFVAVNINNIEQYEYEEIEQEQEQEQNKQEKRVEQQNEIEKVEEISEEQKDDIKDANQNINNNLTQTSNTTKQRELKTKVLNGINILKDIQNCLEIDKNADTDINTPDLNTDTNIENIDICDHFGLDGIINVDTGANTDITTSNTNIDIDTDINMNAEDICNCLKLDGIIGLDAKNVNAETSTDTDISTNTDINILNTVMDMNIDANANTFLLNKNNKIYNYLPNDVNIAVSNIDLEEYSLNNEIDNILPDFKKYKQKQKEEETIKKQLLDALSEYKARDFANASLEESVVMFSMLLRARDIPASIHNTNFVINNKAYKCALIINMPSILEHAKKDIASYDKCNINDIYKKYYICDVVNELIDTNIKIYNSLTFEHKNIFKNNVVFDCFKHTKNNQIMGCNNNVRIGFTDNLEIVVLMHDITCYTKYFNNIIFSIYNTFERQLFIEHDEMMEQIQNKINELNRLKTRLNNNFGDKINFDYIFVTQLNMDKIIDNKIDEINKTKCRYNQLYDNLDDKVNKPQEFTTYIDKNNNIVKATRDLEPYKIVDCFTMSCDTI